MKKWHPLRLLQDDPHKLVKNSLLVLFLQDRTHIKQSLGAADDAIRPIEGYFISIKGMNI